MMCIPQGVARLTVMIDDGLPAEYPTFDWSPRERVLCEESMMVV
jgi:hypothetical protein